MLNVIPRFISDVLNIPDQVREGSIIAPVMYVDIADFTAMTEEICGRTRSVPKSLAASTTRPSPTGR